MAESAADPVTLLRDRRFWIGFVLMASYLAFVVWG